MRTLAQESEHNARRRANGDYKRRGPKKRYTPPPVVAAPPWPVVFRNGRPLPSDLNLDSIITVFDGAGHLIQFIDPTTRIAIDAVTHCRVGVRAEVKEEKDPVEIDLEV